MKGLCIDFNWEESQALKKLAESKLRHPRDQVRIIVRQELQRLGLLDLPVEVSNCQKDDDD